MHIANLKIWVNTMYHIIFENEHVMLESNEDPEHLCVYFQSESTSIVNSVFTCLLQRPK